MSRQGRVLFHRLPKQIDLLCSLGISVWVYPLRIASITAIRSLFSRFSHFLHCAFILSPALQSILLGIFIVYGWVCYCRHTNGVVMALAIVLSVIPTAWDNHHLLQIADMNSNESVGFVCLLHAYCAIANIRISLWIIFQRPIDETFDGIGRKRTVGVNQLTTGCSCEWFIVDCCFFFTHTARVIIWGS